MRGSKCKSFWQEMTKQGAKIERLPPVAEAPKGALAAADHLLCNRTDASQSALGDLEPEGGGVCR